MGYSPRATVTILIKRYTSETRITDGGYETGIYSDDELQSIINRYGEVVENKPGSSIIRMSHFYEGDVCL